MPAQLDLFTDPPAPELGDGGWFSDPPQLDLFTDPPAPELGDGGWFSDPPALPEPQGLQHGDCCDCGGVALVDAQYAGAVRCSACWSRFHGVADLPMPPRGALTRVVVAPRI